MRRPIIFIILFLSIFLISSSMSQEATQKGGFKISTSAFENNGHISPKYTCDGENVNPPLQFENVPVKAKSLALVFDDIDAPRGTYVHWILWNIHPNTKEIKENFVPEGAVQGMNGFKKQNYGGPCPPRRAHRYVFKIYALDIFLNLDPRSAKTDLEKAIEGHVIALTQLMGVYKRVNASQK